MPSSISSLLCAPLNQPAINWQEVLDNILSVFSCTTGTIHFLDDTTGLLKLQAHQGLPAFLLPNMSEIPIGKDMAGIAADPRQPVEMCNLQTDNSGVACPAAKKTEVEGSIAVPMLLDGKLYGTLGIVKPFPYDFTEEEVTDLMAIGAEVSYFIRSNPEQLS